jgi:hypothetical protein
MIVDSKAIIAAAKEIPPCERKLKWSIRCQQYLQRVAADKRRVVAEKKRLGVDKKRFDGQRTRAWIAVNVVFFVMTWSLIVK